jgi:hypothetical protein
MGTVRVQIHAFSSSAIDRGECITSGSVRFTSDWQLRCSFLRKLIVSQGQSGYFENTAPLSPLAGMRTLNNILTTLSQLPRLILFAVNYLYVWGLFRWRCGLRRGPAAVRFLGLRVRISVVIAVCCQVHVFAMGRSFVQRSPTECSVSECDQEQQ